MKFATPTGVIANKDLVEGSQLLGIDGRVRTVGPIEDGEKEMYLVSFKNSRQNAVEQEEFTCSGGHLLCLRIDTPFDKPMWDESKMKYFVKQYIGNDNGISCTKVFFETKTEAQAYYDQSDKRPVKFVLTVDAYLASPAAIRTKSRMYLADPMDFSDCKVLDLAIGRATAEEVGWAVGYWLGDGESVNTQFSCCKSKDAKDAKIKAKLADIAVKMGLVPVVYDCPEKDSVNILFSTQTSSNELAVNPFWQLLVRLGIAENKLVVPELIQQSRSVRAAVAAGFFDANGSYNAGQFELEQSQASHTELFYGFVRLIRTLGFAAHLSDRHVVVDGASHVKLQVKFNGVDAASTLPTATAYKPGKNLVRECANTISFQIKKLGVAPFRKWAVDGDGKVLLEKFVVAHNCPGHDILMATMLNGAAVMDAALLLIAGNESCPQPQTSEHLAAIEIMKLKHIIILQNKIDLVREAQAVEQHQQILKFVEGTVAEGAPIIPISAQLKYNIDCVCEYISTKIPVPVRDFTSPPRLIIIRSFDVNRPGCEVDDLKGGVAGGSILRGVLKVLHFMYYNIYKYKYLIY